MDRCNVNNQLYRRTRSFLGTRRPLVTDSGEPGQEAASSTISAGGTRFLRRIARWRSRDGNFGVLRIITGCTSIVPCRPTASPFASIAEPPPPPPTGPSRSGTAGPADALAGCGAAPLTASDRRDRRLRKRLPPRAKSDAAAAGFCSFGRRIS
uniref:Uncharacterized protein n=1 Tax=Anopheles coluzzii TaxID=1518534 RepID=A0A8W7PXA2_ANOCL